MHTTGLKPLDRPSLTTDLVNRYNSASTLSSAAGNAKNAGRPGMSATDFVDRGDGEFRVDQYPSGVANDSLSVQVAAWNSKHTGGTPINPYASSGRK